jgi:hypothetical protein
MRVFLATLISALMLALPTGASASLGLTTVGSVTNEPGDSTSGSAQVWKATAAQTEIVNRLNVYLRSSQSTSSRPELALYDSARSLLGKCVVTTITPGAWNRCSLLADVAITAGRSYWLEVLRPQGQAAHVLIRGNNSGGDSYGSSRSDLATSPNPWVNGAHWPGETASLYADSGSTPPPPPVDATPPTASFTAPTSGQTVSGTVNVAVNASDTGGSGMKQVSFRADDPASTPVNTDSTTPYGFALDTTTLSNGQHTLYARPEDNAGNIGTDATVAFTVDNSTPPPPPAACADGIDNDSDGLIDYPADPGCTAASDNDETDPAATGDYTLPSDRTYAWNPGLNAIGGIPGANWSIFRTIQPSGGDDTATIESALDNCPNNGVVQLGSGVFHISGQGLAISGSNCVLRGTGPGPGNWPVGQPPPNNATGGTYLVKSRGTSYPVIIIGPRWRGYSGNNLNLTADAVRGSKTATLASTTGLAAGDLVVVDQVTPSYTHWNGAETSGWFEEANRPVGETMEVASVSGNTVTFTTPFPLDYKVSQSAHLFELTEAVKGSGVENLYLYGGEGGDGGGGIHMFECGYCWVKHVEASFNDEPINIDTGFRDEVRDSYIHDAPGGLYNSSSSYGVVLNWYTSQSLFENNIILRFNKVDVMRSAGGGNVFGYNYADDGADSGGQWFETNLNSSHMTTPHYELFEGNEAANFDQDDRWGNSVYVTAFRNHLIGQLRDFPNSGPKRAAGITQWHQWQSFVGNVLGNPTHSGITGYEAIDPSTWGGTMWMICWQNNDSASDGGKCLQSQLRDGNFDYVTNQVHWHGVGGSGVNNGLTPPANSTLPASMYLASKPSFFGAGAWPWVDGSSAANPLPGKLPARARYDSGTPNAS